MSVIETVRLVLEEYELGEPWKLRKGAGFVLPILGRPPFPDRNYVLLQEVLDKVEFKDTGGIGGVNVRNSSGSPVFVRKGTMLKGVGTQSRSPNAGVVLEPDRRVVKIPVSCIHASHGIRTGAAFMARGVTPHSVYQSLGDRDRTWASISNYSDRAMHRAGGMSAALSNMQFDSLVDIEETVGRFRDDVEDLLKQIPGDHMNQVGIAVFDLKGVAGVEVFDHPESWRAFSKSIIRSYSELLTEEVSDLYEIKMDRAEPALRDFLKRASDAERKLVTSNKVSKVWALAAEGVDGELAEVEGREIHLVLSRSTERRQPEAAPTSSRWANQWRTGLRSQRPTYSTRYEGPPIFMTVTTAGPPAEWYRRRGSVNILKELDKEPLRFKELLVSADVSRGTLATRIREARDMGLIYRSIREENGRPVWGLTARGKAEVSEKDVEDSKDALFPYSRGKRKFA